MDAAAYTELCRRRHLERLKRTPNTVEWNKFETLVNCELGHVSALDLPDSIVLAHAGHVIAQDRGADGHKLAVVEKQKQKLMRIVEMSQTKLFYNAQVAYADVAKFVAAILIAEADGHNVETRILALNQRATLTTNAADLVRAAGITVRRFNLDELWNKWVVPFEREMSAPTPPPKQHYNKFQKQGIDCAITYFEQPQIDLSTFPMYFELPAGAPQCRHTQHNANTHARTTR